MRRFWKDATVAKAPGGFEVRLDGRPLRTPARAPLILPSQALADAVAAEWAAQGDEVRPSEMPLTRAANSTIDRVTAARDEVAGMIAAYGETDLLCYRAPHPRELVEEQAARWDPLVGWAAEVLGARLRLVEGVIHVAQEAAAVEALAGTVRRHDPWELTALHDLVTISGSLVLGLAVSHGRLAAQEAWTLSRIDEDWNVREWGEDAEAAAAAERRRLDFANAARLLELLRVA